MKVHSYPDPWFVVIVSTLSTRSSKEGFYDKLFSSGGFLLVKHKPTLKKCTARVATEFVVFNPLLSNGTTNVLSAFFLWYLITAQLFK